MTTLHQRNGLTRELAPALKRGEGVQFEPMAGERHRLAKFTNNEVRRKCAANGVERAELAAMFLVSVSCIQAIVKRKTYWEV